MTNRKEKKFVEAEEEHVHGPHCNHEHHHHHEKRMPIVNEYKKIGRNDPCPCGSEKKYKKCCAKQ